MTTSNIDRITLKRTGQAPIAGEPTPEDRVSAACCSAMRMIRLLTLNAPLAILHAEIRNLTRLVNADGQDAAIGLSAAEIQ